MPRLYDYVPHIDALLGMAPEELARILLRLAKENRQHDLTSLERAVQDLFEGPGARLGYPQARNREIDVAIAEAWNWLKVNTLLVPAPGQNGHNGWMTISRRGAAIDSDEAFQTYRDTVDFPKSLLHPKFSDKVWLNLARGDRADAVFIAFRTVEEAIREAAGYPQDEHGVPMVRKAFAPQGGPLTDMNHPEAEREALAHMFAGALGSYKNPHSHRTVAINDTREAQEMVMLASHLLRIVDDRKARLRNPRELGH